MSANPLASSPGRLAFGRTEHPGEEACSGAALPSRTAGALTAAPCPRQDRQDPVEGAGCQWEGPAGGTALCPLLPHPVLAVSLLVRTLLWPRPVPFSLMVRLCMGLSMGSFPLGMLLFL